MNKWKAGTLKVAGVVLQLGAAYSIRLSALYGMYGNFSSAPLLIGAAMGIAGLILWGKGAQESVRVAEPEPSPKPTTPSEDILLTMQQDIAQLREDQEFFRELYAGATAERETLRQPR